MSLRLAMPTLSPGSVSGSPLDAGYPLAGTRTILAFLETLDVSHHFQSELFTEWTLGFRQSSFHHAVRVSTGGSLDGFTTPRLSGHATFPFRFRVQVGPVTQRFTLNPSRVTRGSFTPRCDALRVNYGSPVALTPACLSEGRTRNAPAG